MGKSGDDEYDPVALCCAWCYSTAPATCSSTSCPAVGDSSTGDAAPPPPGSLKRCANCPRQYCSRECQKKDWSSKDGGGRHHKFWCCKSGEKGTDYEIRSAGETKGLGLFALRDFQRGEKVLVERSVMTKHAGNYTFFARGVASMIENPNTLRAFLSLAPATTTTTSNTARNSNSWIAKFKTNSVALGGNEEGDMGSGVFLHFSRANHDCIGNTSHYFEPKIKLRVLIVDDFIAAGTEITFSYANNSNTSQRRMMMISRGFECRCQACMIPEVGKKLDRILELDKKIMDLGSMGKTEQAVRVGTTLIKLYDEMKSSDISYSRTHYDLFSMNIARKRTLSAGMAHLRKAYQCALRFYGYEGNEMVLKYSELLANPTSHQNYLILG